LLQQSAIFIRVLCFIFILFAAIDCRASAPDSVLNGEYIFTSKEAEFVGSYGDEEVWEVGELEYKLLTFDGQGNGDWQEIYTTGGDSGSFTYKVFTDGTVQISDDDGYHILSKNGSSIMGTYLDSDSYDIFIGLKKSTGMSNANLDGEYLAALYSGDKNGEFGGWEQWELEARCLLLTFHGDGSGTWEDVLSAADLDSGDLTYSVNDDGTFIITSSPNATKGMISPDGNIIRLSEIEEDEFMISIGLKTSTGMSNASLDTAFLMSTHEAELAGSLEESERWEHDARYALVRFDGQGNGTWEDLLSTGDLDSGDLTYSVNDDGTFSMGDEDENTLNIVSPDGHCIMRTEIDSLQLSISFGIAQSDISNAVEEFREEHLLRNYALGQNYPNPFNASTEIRYSLPAAARVSLRVFNVRGEQVATLAEGCRETGTYTVRWDPGELASGIYFCRLQVGALSRTVKMVLLR